MIGRDISKSIKNELDINYKNGIVTSNEIRSLIIQELKNRNQNTVAESYSGYKKNLVTNEREELSYNKKYRSKVGSSFKIRAKQYAKDKDKR